MLRSGDGYRRLLGSRIVIQWADGMFQAALGGAVLFNPEREADPLAVAAGLAVLLLPYSLIGPFAGALLDRWDRRRLLMFAALLRAVLVAGVAGVVAAGLGGPPIYVGGLLVAGVSRFINAGLSVALPHVVPRRHLVEANTLAVTLGAAVVALGAGTAIGLREFIGSGNAGAAITTLVAVLGSVLGSVVVAGFRRGQLGPDRVGPDGQRPPSRSAGFVDGARPPWPRPRWPLVLALARTGWLRDQHAAQLLLFRYAFTDAGLFRSGLAGGRGGWRPARREGVAALLTRAVHPLAAANIQAGCWSPWSPSSRSPRCSAHRPCGGGVRAGATARDQALTDAAVQSEIADEGRPLFALTTSCSTWLVIAVAVAALLAARRARADPAAAAAVLYLLACWRKPGAPSLRPPHGPATAPADQRAPLASRYAIRRSGTAHRVHEVREVDLQPFCAAQARSSASACSWVSGPRSMRSASRCL